jgi:hypothetical protein
MRRRASCADGSWQRVSEILARKISSGVASRWVGVVDEPVARARVHLDVVVYPERGERLLQPGRPACACLAASAQSHQKIRLEPAGRTFGPV